MAKMYRSTITMDEYLKLETICAWKGCTRTTNLNNKDDGWSNMIMYRGELKLNFLEIDPKMMERDTALCPEHARFLDKNLKYIGNDLRDTQGSA